MNMAATTSADETESEPPKDLDCALSLIQLQTFRDRVLSASSPEALFGELAGERAENFAALNKIYFKLANKCQAKHYGSDETLLTLANQAFQHLSELYRTAQESIRNDTYRNASRVAKAVLDKSVIAIVEADRYAYSLRELISEGDVSSVYRAEYVDENSVSQHACIKIAKSIEENELIENEQNILADLDHVSVPKIIENFWLADGRAATAMTYAQGPNLYQLREMPMYAQGLKQDAEYHIGWILERQLALLGYLHKQGIVHGSVEPSHLIVQGDIHNVVLIDFCWAIKNPTDSDNIKIGQQYYSAPEVFEKATPHPAMDIYGLGKSAVYLLGGDPENGYIPDSLNSMLAKFIARMTEDDQSIRASDAHQLAYHLVIIRDELHRPFAPLPTEKPTLAEDQE